MPTIGVRAAKMLGVTKNNLVEIMNKQAVKRGSSTPWMKATGALTDAGQSVYKAEKSIYGAKNLKEYLSAITHEAKFKKFEEPFDKLLDIII